MFVIVATKPLNDGQKVFVSTLFGKKGLLRKRKSISRGWFKRQRMADICSVPLWQAYRVPVW